MDHREKRGYQSAVGTEAPDYSSCQGYGAECAHLVLVSAGPLHLAFFAVKALALRVIMAPATTLAKANPFSNLRRFFESSLEEFKPFVRLISSLGIADLHAFWGRSECVSSPVGIL